MVNDTYKFDVEKTEAIGFNPLITGLLGRLQSPSADFIAETSEGMIFSYCGATIHALQEPCIAHVYGSDDSRKKTKTLLETLPNLKISSYNL